MNQQNSDSETPSSHFKEIEWTEDAMKCSLLRQYRPIRVAGRGAFGLITLVEPIVNRALSKEPVVIKQVFTELTLNNSTSSGNAGSQINMAEHAKAEIQILAMLKHPNITRFIDCASYLADRDAQGRETNQICWVIAMEYANAGNLYQYLRGQTEPLDHETICSYTGQLLLAMHYIHSQNILHRDSKSHNILLHLPRIPTGSVVFHPSMYTLKLADFGIAKLFLSPNVSANTVIGTPNYLSPELCQGDPYDEKSDIWALGCILFEIATRKFMFEAPNLLALTRRIIENIPVCQLPEATPSVIKDLVPKMTAPTRDQRISIQEAMCIPTVQSCLVEAFIHNVY